jgi:hypothetical protein
MLYQLILTNYVTKNTINCNKCGWKLDHHPIIKLQVILTFTMLQLDKAESCTDPCSNKLNASYHYFVQQNYIKETEWVAEVFTPWRKYILKIPSPVSLPDGSGCCIRMIQMSVLGLQTSHLLLIRTNLGYGTVLMAACTHLGCTSSGHQHHTHHHFTTTTTTITTTTTTTTTTTLCILANLINLNVHLLQIKSNTAKLITSQILQWKDSCIYWICFLVLTSCRSWFDAKLSRDHTASIIRVEVKRSRPTQFSSHDEAVWSPKRSEADQLLHGANIQKQVQYQ